MGGNIQLSNLSIKRDFFENPRVPFALHHGFIRSIRVSLLVPNSLPY